LNNAVIELRGALGSSILKKPAVTLLDHLSVNHVEDIEDCLRLMEITNLLAISHIMIYL
jgi:hypothetical protein